MTTSPDEAKAALLEATVARVHEHVSTAARRPTSSGSSARTTRTSLPRTCSTGASSTSSGPRSSTGTSRASGGPDEAKVHVYTPNVEQHGWQSPHTVVETVVDGHAVPRRLGLDGDHEAGDPDPPRRSARSCRCGATTRARLLEVGERRRCRRVARSTSRSTGWTDPEAVEQLRARPAAGAGRRERGGRGLVGDACSARTKRSTSSPSSRRQSTREEAAEARELLEWMRDDHFTFLGYEEYEVELGGR